ncbi:MAG TPA: hypothetical protein VD997_14155 [Phycisphaerales bacterium]|nr:hypothetical protein [Phycisphaerales bacterium]
MPNLQPSMDPVQRLREEPGVLRVIGSDYKRASLSGLLVSIVVHACFLIIAAMVVVGGRGGDGTDGSGGGDPGPIEMAVVSEGELSEIQDAAMGADTPSVPDAAVRDVEVTTNIPDVGPATGGGAEGLGEIGTLSGGGDISLGGGEGSGLGGSGGGGANFFGVEAQGSRFAYLVDVSGSMGEPLANGEGTRIETLRKELARSVNGLLENSQVFVIAFSTGAEPINGRSEWIDASPAGKKKLAPLIVGLQPLGGTNPMPGFEIIYNMKPRPDAIYFMTDGDFNETVVDEVASLNQKLKIPIHCICLGTQAGQENMKAIAKQSKGKFTVIGGAGGGKKP